jgi:uncharacterized membrane protein
MGKRTLVLNRPIRIQLLVKMDRYQRLCTLCTLIFAHLAMTGSNATTYTLGLGSVVAMGVNDSTTRVGGCGALTRGPAGPAGPRHCELRATPSRRTLPCRKYL